LSSNGEVIRQLKYFIKWQTRSHHRYLPFFITFLTICGNKMPPRCNRGFYCRSYCLLNMFRVPLCPSSGAQGYYTVVAACGISCCGFQVAALVWSWGLCVRFAGCWFTFPHINDDARSKSHQRFLTSLTSPHFLTIIEYIKERMDCKIVFVSSEILLAQSNVYTSFNMF